MKKIGSTGNDSAETCFAGACDIVTPEAQVTEYTYKQYRGVMNHWDQLTKQGANRQNAVIGELYGLIALDLGGYTIEQWDFCYAHTAKELAKLLARLRDSGKRIVLDTIQRTGEVHSVGVKPLDDDRYKIVGYEMPSPLANKSVTAEQIHPFLYESGFNVKPKQPYVGCNVVGLPKPHLIDRTPSYPKPASWKPGQRRPPEKK